MLFQIDTSTLTAESRKLYDKQLASIQEVAFEEGLFFRHVDGGYYRMEAAAAMHTGTKEELVIYRHVFPFESRLYARPAVEWTPERFTAVDINEIALLQNYSNREEYQQFVTERRNARKAKSSK